MAKTIVELKQNRDLLLKEAEGILDDIDSGDRNMNADEKARYDAAVAGVAELNESITLRMKLETVAAPTFSGGAPAVREQPSNAISQDEFNAGGASMATVRESDTGSRVEIVRSYGKMQAFKNDSRGQLDAYRAGQWLSATLYGNANSAEWCRKNGVGVRSALSGGVNTSGGALVPVELERAIIDLRETYGLFRRVCQVNPMSSDTLSIPRRTGGLSAYFVGDGVAGTESDAGWDSVNLVAKKLMVLTRMSSEVSEDAIINLADTMAMEIAYAFAVKEDACGFNGDGSQTYGGITGVLVKALQSAHSKAKVACITPHNKLDEVDANDLLNLMGAIPQYAKPGSAWYCSPSAQELVFNAIKIAGGGTTRDMLADSDVPRFLGYPINVTPVMADDPSADYNGAVMIGFGNLRQAVTMGDRRGIRVALSNDQYFSEDQIAIKGTERFDINVHDLGSTTVKSPFAVLVGTT